MTFEKDKHGEILNYFVQSRAESALIVVALTIGIFSTLVMFDKAAVHSLAWIVLSIIYWTLILVILFIFFGTAFNIIMINHLVRSYFKEFDKDVAKVLEDTKLAKRSFADLFKDPDNKRIDRLTIAFLVVFPVLAGLLWYAVAFKQFAPLW